MRVPIRRRFSGQVIGMAHSSFLAAQGGDGVAHLFVGAAAADVAGQPFLDLGGRGLGVLVQGGPHGDDEAGRAEAALLGVVLHEGGGHGIESAVAGQRLGRLDLAALGFQGQHGAGVDRLAVEHDGAGAAGAAVADALAAGDVEVVAQRVEQRDARLDAVGHLGAVDGQCDLGRRGADGWGFGHRRPCL